MDKYFIQILGTRADFLEGVIRDLACKVEIIGSPDKLKPEADICLGWGIYNIIKTEYLNITRLGIWGFHESALPKGRGCAPIHWTVLGGQKELTVSFFEMVKEMDAGRLLGQEKKPITDTDLLEDIRGKANELVRKLIDKYLISFLEGKAIPYSQSGVPTFYKKRTFSDSKLDTEKTLLELWDLIRICDNEKYPAWFEINGRKFILKRYNSDFKQ